MADKFGTGAPIQFKTGTIAKLEIDDSVAKDVGAVYFAVDTTNEKGKIYFDASNDLRIPMAVYTVATTSEDGLMSADDKAKLDAHNGRLTTLENKVDTNATNIAQKQETLKSDVQKAQSDADSANSEAKKAQENAQNAVTKSEEANALATSAYNGLNDLEQVVKIDSTGVKVLEKANSKNYFQIKSDGMHVFNNGEDVAQFGQQSKMNNLAVKDFFMFGAHRAETLTVNGEVGTAFYWIGDVE